MRMTFPRRRLALVLSVAVLALAASGVAARRPELSDEQRRALRDLRDRLEDSGADAATCRAEHDRLFRSWGLEPPAGGPGLGPCGAGMGPGPGGERMKLSAGQRRELRALRDRLEDNGADAATCRAEHDRLFRSWGLEPPAGGPGLGPCGAGMGPGPRGGRMQLSAGQRRELRALRDRLEDSGADSATCRAEHDRLFRSWGLEPPAGGPGLGLCGAGLGPGHRGGRMQLSAGQRRELRALRERLEDEGADPETRRAEHDRLFRSWGLEPPAGGPGRGGRGWGRGHGGPGRGPCARTAASADADAPGAGGGSAGGGTARTTLLRGNQPNPFNPETTIRFALPEAGVVLLRVFDLDGRLVRTLVDGRREAGDQRVVWGGEREDGSPAASGQYIYRIEFQGAREAGTMTLLR